MSQSKSFLAVPVLISSIAAAALLHVPTGQAGALAPQTAVNASEDSATQVCPYAAKQASQMTLNDAQLRWLLLHVHGIQMTSQQQSMFGSAPGTTAHRVQTLATSIGPSDANVVAF